MTDPLDAGAGEASPRFLGERGEKYFVRYARGTDASAELNLPKFAEHVAASDTVVDFGCGSGALLQRLLCARRIGVEVSQPAREQAQSRGIETHASSTELPDEIADVVISNHALEHTLHPLAELRELHRLLKPGGRFVLWLPLDDWRVQRFADDTPDNHLYTWTPRLLGNLMREAGFDFDPNDVRVVTKSWRHSYLRLSRVLPRPVYSALTSVTAIALRRRQLHAMARKRT